MKLNKYIWMLALSILVSACQDDALVDTPQGQDGKFVLNASVSEKGSFSRAQIKLEEQEDGRKYGAFQWDEGDKFRLYEVTGDDENRTVSATHDFEISGYSNTSPSTSATFVSETTPTDGNRFYALYPSSFVIDEEDITFTISINDVLTDNTAVSWKNYFNDNMFMWAEGSIRGTETRLEFSHLCGLVNVSYTNNTDTAQYIKEISMNGEWCKSKKLYLYNTWNGDDLEPVNNGYGISFTNPVMVDAGTEENFFILFIQPNGEPKSMSQLSIEFTDESGSNSKVLTTDSYTIGMPTFYRGSGYRLNVKHTTEGKLVWAKAPVVEGYKVSTPEGLVAALKSSEHDSIVLNADIALDTTLMINKNFTIDLAGFKLTNNKTDLAGFAAENALIVVKRGAHLTINDVSGVNTGLYTGIIEPTYVVDKVLESTIKMVSATDESTESAKLTINGGNLNGYKTILGNKGKGNTEITINGGDIWAGFDGGDAGITHPQAGTLNVNGGQISGGRVGIEMGAGNLNLKGGRVYKNKCGYDKGIALYISQGADNLPLNVTIEKNANVHAWDDCGDWNGAYAIYEEDLYDNGTDNVSITIQNTHGVTGHIYSENKKGFIGSNTSFNSPSALSYIAPGAKNVEVYLEDRYGDYHGPAACIPDSEAENGAEVTVDLNGKTWTIEGTDADNNYFYVGKNNKLTLRNGIVCVPEDATGLSLIKGNNAELNFMNVTINSYNVHYAVDVEDGKTRFMSGRVNAGEGCYAFNITSSGLDKTEPMFDLREGNEIHGNFKLSVAELLENTESFRAHVLHIENTTIEGDLFVSENITNEWLYYCVNRGNNVVIPDQYKGWNSVQNATDENLPTLPVYITDPNWIAVIKENYYGVDPYKQPFNETDEGYIDVNDDTNKSIIEGMINIRFESEQDYSDIKELQHIERFINLKYLDVLNTSVDSLNLSNNKSLENVYFSGNKLNTLILDSLQSLTDLSCSDENLEVIPSTKGCTSLNSLSLNMPKLTALDLSDCQSLKELHLTETPIQGTLDLSAVTLLEKLEVWDGAFTSIDLSKNKDLQEIILNGEQALTSLDVTGCPSVSKVEFGLTNYNYNLTSFNAEGCTLLDRVEIRSNNVPMEVNLNGCTSLTYAWLYNCKSLSLNGCKNLKDLWCSESPELTTLDVRDCTGMTYLSCQSSGLTSLDVTGLTLLEGLMCDYCHITELKGLDSGLSVLERLFCSDNQLNSLNVKSLPALEILECGDNKITTLDLSGLTALTDVRYYDSPVITLNVSGCTSLESLFLQAGLKNLDITGCTNLLSLQKDTDGNVQMESVKMDTIHDTFFQGTNYLWGEKDSTKYPIPAHKQGYQYPVFTYSTTVE